MKKWLYIAVSALLAAGCAREKTINDNVATKRYLDAWLQVNYPNIPATGKGVYIIEDTPGTGKELSENDDMYVFVTYTQRLLSGTVSATSDPKMAQQLGSYKTTTYYGPVPWLINKNTLNAGIRETLRGMKVGGKRTAVVPGWLNVIADHETAQEYLDSETGTHNIYSLYVTDATTDIKKWEIDSLESYSKRVLGVADSLVYGFYYKCLNPDDVAKETVMPNDTTFYINYTGRLLNGLVFDTTIEDTAKFYGIYSASKTYEPVAINKKEDYRNTSMGDDSTAEGNLVDGFGYCCSILRPFERGICTFYSARGYAANGNGSSIPAYASLRFDIDVVAKPK